MTDYVAEARKLRVSIVQLARYAPDEVAATAAFAFEPWDPNSAYEAGDRVQYPAASNAHLKALRLNLVGLLAPRGI